MNDDCDGEKTTSQLKTIDYGIVWKKSLSRGEERRGLGNHVTAVSRKDDVTRVLLLRILGKLRRRQTRVKLTAVSQLVTVTCTSTNHLTGTGTYQ